MSTEKDKKALKAFWCVLDTAEEKRRKVSYYFDSINIWANTEEGRGIVADIHVKKRENKVKLKKYLFGLFYKYDYETKASVYGEVTNVSDKITHYFSFDGEEALEIEKAILEEYNNYQETRKRKREKSLNELIC